MHMTLSKDWLQGVRLHGWFWKESSSLEAGQVSLRCSLPLKLPTDREQVVTQGFYLKQKCLRHMRGKIGKCCILLASWHLQLHLSWILGDEIILLEEKRSPELLVVFMVTYIMEQISGAKDEERVRPTIHRNPIAPLTEGIHFSAWPSKSWYTALVNWNNAVFRRTSKVLSTKGGPAYMCCAIGRLMNSPNRTFTLQLGERGRRKRKRRPTK